MALYEEFGKECASMLWGMFGFVLYNQKTHEIFAARDGLGVCSLYYGEDEGRLYISSEMKCIPCEKVYIFPPGTMCCGKANNYQFVSYYKPQWSNITPHRADLTELVRRLELSVNYHMTCDVPLGCFLSGGLNSSIIAALASSIMKKQAAENDGTMAKLKTFTIGMKNSTDVLYAREVAKYLDTEHVEVQFTAQEGIDLIPELIWHLETYDPFTIRAAIPMYILSRIVRSSGTKVILSGEGADEIFGGYLYYHSSPSADDFRQETIERLLGVHLSDGLRANKTSMAQSVELRAPFLGSPLVNYAMGIDPVDRMPKPRYFTLLPTSEAQEPEEQTPYLPKPEQVLCERCEKLGSQDKPGTLSTMEDASPSAFDSYDDPNAIVEKWLLRKAFEGMLPEDVVWRQKEQFCDGVGSQWVTSLQQYAEDRISDAEFDNREKLYPHNTPTTKEEFLYRQIFAMEYPGEDRAKTVVMWKPKWVEVSDTTGRANPFHWSRSPDSNGPVSTACETPALSVN